MIDSTNKSVDPFDFYVLKCGENVFQEKEHNLVHIYYPDENEDQDEDEDKWRIQREH